MPLQNVQFQGGVYFGQKKTVTGFDPETQNSKLEGRFAMLTTAGNARQTMLAQGTLAAGASVTFDLNSFTGAFGVAVTGTGAYGIVVTGSGTTWRYDTPSGGGTNPLVWFLGAAGQQINLGAGAFFVIADPVAITVDATNKNIRLTNTAGAGTLTYTIAVVIKSAS